VKRLLLILLLVFPNSAFAYVTGVDDIDPHITQDEQDKFDAAVLSYYKEPTTAKVNIVLDLMNNTEMLRKKTSWPPLVGFLTVVFGAHKDHVMNWMSRNDYNTYAEDVIVAALLHAKLKESALVFAQAHHWKPEEIEHIREYEDPVDMKTLVIVLPGHIDTLWGAFFASGDEIYVEEIINVLFMKELPMSETVDMPAPTALEENKRLAEKTLTYYAPDHPAVREAIERRIKEEDEGVRKLILRQLLPNQNSK